MIHDDANGDTDHTISEGGGGGGRSLTGLLPLVFVFERDNDGVNNFRGENNV